MECALGGVSEMVPANVGMVVGVAWMSMGEQGGWTVVVVVVVVVVLFLLLLLLLLLLVSC